MIQKSFILFKPDVMKSKIMQSFIYNKLDMENLKVIEKKEILMKREAVTALWDFTLRDVVCKTILENYIGEQLLTLLIIEGDEALQKTCKIKAEIRKQYAKTFFINCIHAPKNENEYKKDMHYLFHKIRGEIGSSLIYDTSLFSRYSKLKTEKLKQCANELFLIMEHDNFFISPPIIAGKFNLYLYNDNVHEMVYVAAALFEFIPGITLTKAYLFCIYVEINGRTPVMALNNKEEIDYVYSSLLKAGLNVKLSKINECNYI